MHTDDTHFDTPTPTHSYESDRQPASLIPPRGSRRSRRTAMAVALFAAVLTIVGAWFASASVSSGDGDDAAAALDLADGDVAAGVDEASSDADVTPEPETPPAPEVDGDEPAPADDDELADDPEPEPADPCDLLADGQTLAVSSEETKLPVGQYAGELLITNCGDEATQWSAATLSPDVQLGVADGMLAAGATVDVQFALDPSAIAGSKLSFFITVSEPGFETQVMVTATKVIVNPGVLIPKQEITLELDE